MQGHHWLVLLPSSSSPNSFFKPINHDSDDYNQVFFWKINSTITKLRIPWEKLNTYIYLVTSYIQLIILCKCRMRIPSTNENTKYQWEYQVPSYELFHGIEVHVRRFGLMREERLLIFQIGVGTINMIDSRVLDTSHTHGYIILPHYGGKHHEILEELFLKLKVSSS